MTSEIEKVVSRAKVGMLQQEGSAFLSTICFSLQQTITNKIPTVATNGKTLLINPDFFSSLSVDEQVFVLAHESLHVAYMHMIRVDDRDFRRWNRACDYVINEHLISQGLKMPKMGLYNPDFKGMSSEQVYDALENLPDDSDFEPDMEDPTSGDSQEDEQVRKEIQDIVIRAQLQAQMQGQGGDAIPAEIRRLIEDLLKPKIKWQIVLARFLKSMSRSDYSFKKFNRKYLQNGMYFPTLISEGNLSQVDFAVDVSGSVTPRICTQFCSEIYAVLQHYSPEKIGVYQFGTRVVKTDIVRGVKDLLTMEFVDGGGTLISPVFEQFKKSPAKALIILTDGEIWQNDKFKKPDNRPVIWCIYNNPKFTCDFGKIIHFTFN